MSTTSAVQSTVWPVLNISGKLESQVRITFQGWIMSAASYKTSRNSASKLISKLNSRAAHSVKAEEETLHMKEGIHSKTIPSAYYKPLSCTSNEVTSMICIGTIGQRLCTILRYLLVSSLNELTNSVVLVHKRTIPTERPQPAGEVSANFS
jgi:hypothetical protein